MSAADDINTLDRGTKLAAERTWLAHERTMMAWVRTATSLISFGFTIYKFFQIEAAGKRPPSSMGPREFALLMISIGIVSLVIASISHHRSMKQMRGEYPFLPRSTAGFVAWLIGGLGVVALIAVALRT